MTAQISDSFRYRDRGFRLTGVKGSGLFDPTRHGLQPQMMSTACYRGFICSYSVTDGGLFLEELCIGLSNVEKLKARHGRGMPLFGKTPRCSDETHQQVMYEALHARVPFSGGLLLANGFIRELYVHMGFHPAWKFQEVHELLFEEGVLLEEIDCSAAMARVRERLGNRPLAPGSSASQGEIEQWVSKSFRLDYD
ncbi:hypothetical protein JY651_35015 [Pyxidicoccus parkwayensis]|jgi:hypothetical protein|uniref:Uncharacterized protein n=1 Tax=Pyxidicoccus parkwayensis TaxID=2813578 RepID=A0ABX7NSQ4_9BACT|nr:hypothetical protein [Pyxidicoccus parkwaysis]QSQ20431.1 hypothetical protein JY651_35015 [Pyxidicoccus parkwaysis]